MELALEVRSPPSRVQRIIISTHNCNLWLVATLKKPCKMQKLVAIASNQELHLPSISIKEMWHYYYKKKKKVLLPAGRRTPPGAHNQQRRKENRKQLFADRQQPNSLRSSTIQLSAKNSAATFKMPFTCVCITFHSHLHSSSVLPTFYRFVVFSNLSSIHIATWTLHLLFALLLAIAPPPPPHQSCLLFLRTLQKGPNQSLGSKQHNIKYQ